MKKKIIIIVGVVLSIFITLIFSVLIFFSINYDAVINHEVLESNEKIEVISDDNYIAFIPNEEYSNAIIFYQGAKVDETSYAPMIKQIAEKNILCFIVKMPFDFALFNINAADKIIDKYDKDGLLWYISGHSLGGTSASMYAASNLEKISGVILIASYSTVDISSLNVLSIYGNNDHVLNLEKYSIKTVNLPSDFQEVIIDGGNHANFGYYGIQKNDGEAYISKEQQINITVSCIVSFILNKKN